MECLDNGEPPDSLPVIIGYGITRPVYVCFYASWAYIVVFAEGYSCSSRRCTLTCGDVFSAVNGWAMGQG
ncbi:hypothetical protein H9L39_06681 [Fusarium oxysporum f. sp. albedinis]|nr:hypothetical protein H9L39_06681 [Fusarium oxysporum f. sp. albedinis]